ncbi:MAG: hypothetical protein R2817_14905 [Flavobacteriales bacterium]
MSTHTASMPPFILQYPGLVVDVDTDGSGTVIFNNTILNSSFNWNSRQGISWTGCSGLHAINTDLNYNGAGRINRSSPGSGMDIEGGGGPMRVRYGVFDNCRFLHNRLAGVISDNFQCIGQQDFQFNNCTFKAGVGEIALWPEARAMRFYQCEIYGKVNQMFERAENVLPHDPNYDLVFRRTNFYEEDEQWNYIGDYSSDSVWTATCAGFDVHKLDVLNGALSGRKAGVVYDSCGFFTNCYANVRFLGRSIGNSPSDLLYPYCPDGSGPYLGTDTAQDARYVKLLNSTLTNTGRKRCGAQTPIFSMALATTTNLVVNRPTEVRGATNVTDTYTVPLANYPFESCFPNFCPAPTYILTDYAGEFPPCQPFFGLSDTVAHWAFCNPDGVNIPTSPCGSYTLRKSASVSETYLDSTVTFTITVCNNSFFATPVMLSEQWPPSFAVTGAEIWSGADTTLWSTLDTTLTLNNGQCVELWITGYFTAFGEFTNTVTLALDTAVAGEVLSATATVHVLSTCEAELIIPDSTLASEADPVLVSTVANIQGLFVVDEDVAVSNALLVMEPGAEIVVRSGATLDIRNSTLRSCNNVMWRGITVEAGGLLYLANSFVDDAENAVKALDSAVVSTLNNQFHNNRVSIHVPAEAGTVQNSITIGSKNNLFYSSGPMPAPYPGQQSTIGSTGFAAFDVQRVPLYLTNGWNVFHHLSNGIVAIGCDIRVRDCSFHHIGPDPAYQALVGNGSAIHASGGGGWHTLDQVGSFVNGLTPFRECRWGVYTKRMNVYSSANTMEQVGTAYHIEKSGSRDVHIHTNTLDTKYDGLELLFNDEAVQLLVEDNAITFGSNPPPGQFTKGYTAIRVEEGNGQNWGSVIRNNNITYRSGVTTAHTGIKLTAATNYLLAGNVMTMSDNATNYAGVQLLGCYDTEVSCNAVVGGNNGYPQKGQAAIRNVKGGTPYVSCNDMDRTTNGLLFSGESYGADVRGNHIRRHKWGLHLDGTAIIDVQELKGNLWYDAAQAGGIEALYEVDNFESAFSLFRVDPITLNGADTWPPNWSPEDWFVEYPGTTYDCANDHGAEYCEQFGREKCDTCLNGLDARIAGDSLQNDPYTEQTQWTLKGDLYAKLDGAPELRDSLPDLDAFYTAMQNEVIGQLKEVEDERTALAYLDASVTNELKENQQQMAGVLALVKEAMVQLEDSTLTTNQRQAVMATLAGYRQNISDLAEYNANVVELAHSSKVLTAEGVRAANAALGATELTESNAKAVNEIHLATIGKEVDHFTVDQTSALFEIANQCPMVGGNAVFRARALYSLIDEGQDYDDELLCLQHGILVKSLDQPTGSALSVVPNPTSDEATLVLAEPLDDPGVFIVYDALGAEVLRHLVAAESLRHIVNTEALAPALYYYQVRGPSGLLGVGKLTIVR